jgi:pSer/pThr/pTyr-binding forkhead associated (FHA) protein
MTFNLEIVEGPGAGRRMPLGASLVVGRGPGVDISLDDSRVSSRHARIALDDGGEIEGDRVIVEDLGSSNGTFVNGMAVDGPTWLAVGDVLLVGVTLLTLRGYAAAVAPGASAYREPRGPHQPVLGVEGTSGSGGLAELQRLLDVNVKRRAQSAPPALLTLVVAIVSIYLVMR